MSHFRIQRSSIGAYFVSDKISFATLGELISYYQRNNRSLGVLLQEPCAQQVGRHPTRHPTHQPNTPGAQSRQADESLPDEF